MKEKLRNKRNGKVDQGITLVALVVTIVVLLILAGVSIVTLFGENGIITAAQKAKDETNRGVTGETTNLGNLENDMNKALGINSVGNNNGWQEVKNEKGQVTAVKKGDRQIEIGDYINYDCTKNASGQTITESYTSYAYGKENNDHNGRTSGYNKDQTFKAKDYTGQWRVLGSENGELLIMPVTNVTLKAEGIASPTKDFYLIPSLGTAYVEQGKVAYKYVIEELDNISRIYAKGKGATGEGRSIKVEDVNKITGYKPEAPAGSEDNKSGKDELWEYGNEVTYTWKGGTAPYYSGNKGNKTGTLSTAHNTSAYGFTYWDEESNDWVKSPYTSTAQTSPITTLTSTDYAYFPETLTEKEDTSATTGIANNSKQRDMLFGNDECYFLNSRYVRTDLYDVVFGLRDVSGNCVTINVGFIYSYGYTR